MKGLRPLKGFVVYFFLLKYNYYCFAVTSPAQRRLRKTGDKGGGSGCGRGQTLKGSIIGDQLGLSAARYDCLVPVNNRLMPWLSASDRVATEQGKQGIWLLLFPDRENTGNFAVTQGKFLRHRENIFDCIYDCKKHVSLHIFSIFFSLALLGILSSFRSLFLILFLPV